MRVRVLGQFRLGSESEEKSPPSGRVGVLLRWLLLRPNETHTPETLISVVWPDDSPEDEETGSARLHVAVSRLRRFLGNGSQDGSGVEVVTEEAGYRLHADAGAMDRVAFESLANRALGGEPEVATEALALWRGDPYTGFPSSEEMQRQRFRLVELRHHLERLGDERVAAWSLRDSFARTKFIRPKVDTTLRRERLLAATGSVGEASLITVAAPAGFGKSVLLSQWAAMQRSPVAWLTLEDEDNDPVRFWSAVLHGFVETGEVDLSPVPKDATPGSPRFIEALVGVVAGNGAPVGLVLDDAHHLVNTELLDQLGGHLAHLPAGLTVAAGSRSALPFPTKGFTEAGRLRVITADDLRFDPGEAAEVMRRENPDVDEAAVAAVAGVAEGWPVAVSHLARSGAGVDHSGRVAGAIEEYVFEEVLGELPDRVRRFVLGTAHLDRLNASLCDAVLGADDTQRVLGWLVDHDWFIIDVGSEDGWYRYHHLVADVLRRNVEADPGADVGEGHRRAARWYRTHELLEEALEHAITGGDDETVAAVFGDVLWEAVARGEIYTCQRWLYAIDPDALVSNRASHDLAMACVSAWLDPESSRAWLESRRRLYGEAADPMPAFVINHHLNAQGRHREATAAAEEALGIVDVYFDAHPNRPGFKEGVAATLRLATFSERIATGNLHFDDPEVARTLDEVRERFPVMLIWVLGEAAFLAYVEGDHEQAARLVEEIDHHFASMDRASIDRGAARALVARALLESDHSDDEETQRRIISRLAPLVSLYEDLGRWTDLIPVRLALHVASARAGDAAAAGAHLAHADLLLAPRQEASLLATARARLATGSDEPAPTAKFAGEPLTTTERLVLAGIYSGSTYAELAEKLNTSVNTITKHASSIYRKLGFRNRFEATRNRGVRRDWRPTPR